jgi:2-polyprenyl-6-methoxyphenol hydroxylase-like FAD-dependent oxidoreductase
VSEREILVAGGGIGGLAAALALAQKGRKVRVLRNELGRARDPDDPWEADWLYKWIEVNGRL